MSDDEYTDIKDDKVDELADLLEKNVISEKIVNKGTGAGGANTNITGKSFYYNTKYLNQFLATSSSNNST